MRWAFFVLVFVVSIKNSQCCVWQKLQARQFDQRFALLRKGTELRSLIGVGVKLNSPL